MAVDKDIGRRGAANRDIAISALSQREMQVLSMAARGLTNGEIALSLEVTVHAIKFHLGSIYRKLDVTNRTQAAATYLSTPHESGTIKTGGRAWI